MLLSVSPFPTCNTPGIRGQPHLEGELCTWVRDVRLSDFSRDYFRPFFRRARYFFHTSVTACIVFLCTRYAIRRHGYFILREYTSSLPHSEPLQGTYIEWRLANTIWLYTRSIRTSVIPLKNCSTRTKFPHLNIYSGLFLLVSFWSRISTVWK